MLFFLVLCLSVSCVSVAQLTKTKWKGSMLIPDETETIVSFSKDTMLAFIGKGETLLETSTYTVKGDTLLLKSVSGSSQCGPQTIGVYRWAIKGSSLSISPVTDDCSRRFQAWSNQPFVRMQQ